MEKLIICDKNKKLINYLKKVVEAAPNKTGIEFEFVCGDVIKLHDKIPNSRIVTASNPSFSPDGGLDAVLAAKFKWEKPKEFLWNNDLFWVVSVDEGRQAKEALIRRALVGVLGYLPKFTMLLTGIGTGVGGLAVEVLGQLLIDILRSANLSSADLRSADLSSADLRSADLRSADLRSANLSSANLSSANLSSADLSSADLSFADLSFADLSSADLRSADLRSANLSSANLSSANLSSANLSFANLSSANLSSANLSFADLSSADLRYAKILKVRHNETTAFYALSCPETGAFIGWKKASGCIVKLQITEKAKRSSATTRKCRCSEAKVLGIWDGKKKVKKATSNQDATFIYEVGKTVKTKEPFDKDRWNECASGIHFFLTRGEAELWTN